MSPRPLLICLIVCFANDSTGSFFAQENKPLDAIAENARLVQKQLAKLDNELLDIGKDLTSLKGLGANVTRLEDKLKKLQTVLADTVTSLSKLAEQQQSLETRLNYIVKISQQVGSMDAETTALETEVAELKSRFHGWRLQGAVTEDRGSLYFMVDQGYGIAERRLTLEQDFEISLTAGKIPHGQLDIRLLGKDGASIASINVASYFGRPDKHVSVFGRQKLFGAGNLSRKPIVIKATRTNDRLVVEATINGQREPFVANRSQPVTEIRLEARPSNGRGEAFRVEDFSFRRLEKPD